MNKDDGTESDLGGEMLYEHFEPVGAPPASDKAKRIRELADDIARHGALLGSVVMVWVTDEPHPSGDAGFRVYADGWAREGDWPYLIDALVAAAKRQEVAIERRDAVDAAEATLSRAQRRRQKFGRDA
jgi:nucleotide-binding universal stress UspA family protein